MSHTFPYQDQHLPAPQNAGYNVHNSQGGHQQRHSVAYGASHPYSPLSSGSPRYEGGQSQSAFPVPQVHHRQGSMSSAMPYPGPQQPSYSQQNELLPPPATSNAFSLGRSASLGTRRKDPYAYSSDDVESGLGNMDMTGDSSWNNNSYSGYSGSGPSGGNNGNYLRSPNVPQLPTTNVHRYSGQDVVMSPTRPSPNQQMNPPPIPPHALTIPSPQIRTDSAGGSSPSRGAYTPGSGGSRGGHASRDSLSNPYIPRASDSGPSGQSAQDQQSLWTDHRRPGAGDRMASSSSYNLSSPAPGQLSPFIGSDQFPSSPHSPLIDPYEASPHMSAEPNLPPSPMNSVPTSWLGNNAAASSAYMKASPMSPPQPMRAKSSQTYPASQPVTPASKGPYDMGPPRGLPMRPKSGGTASRTGFRDVSDVRDLKPVINAHPQGRRADPLAADKYLSPLKCLTSSLPQTYTLCNPTFRYETSENPRRVLTKPSKPVHNDGADNEDWDYILYVNDVLGGDSGGDRYLILDVLGQGTFGQVVKCQNMRTHEILAVKVVKNKPAYLNQSKMEVAILELLNTQWDPNDTRHILRMQEHFTHKNHLCLVFECLSSNLYELIKQNQFKGLSTQLVKVFTQQLLDCLAVLKDARLIHCDLKPENILLKSLQSPQVKVIDFGSACHEMATVYTYIQSRFYRSPEVLLGLPYSTSIDMWSLGCIVVELFLGLPLFPGTSEYNQVSRIVDMLGNPPGHLLEVGKQTHEFFNYTGTDAFGKKQYVLKSMEQYATEHRTKEQPSKQYFKQTKLREIIMEYPFAKKNPKQADIDKEMANRKAFVDFVSGCLILDPIQRWSPQQAAKHPFITGEKFTGPFQPQSQPSRKNSVAPPESPSNQTTPTSKKYGNIVQTPPSASRGGQRVYSEAAAYPQQMSHHNSYSAQMQAANANRQQPFSPGYDMTQAGQSSPYNQRVASQSHASRNSQQQQWQHIQPPPQPNFGARIPSQGLPSSASQSSLRVNPPQISVQTNPPPNSYYPSTRNRANTINKLDAIPPALARLAHFGVPDPSGTRNLTPVMNRDDAIREWERRQSGHSKNTSMANASYPQLEYLQEQAELAAMSNAGWMMPAHGAGSHHGGHAHRPSHGGHSHHNSFSGTQAYQMQPGLGVQSSPGYVSTDYRRSVPGSGPTDYENQASSSRSYLPAFPPPAAVSNVSSPHAGFDGFDNRDQNMGMMYTPLQPTAYSGAYASGTHGHTPHGSIPGHPQGHAQGHGQSASYSGPYHNGNGGGGGGQNLPPLNNPFAPNQNGRQGQSNQGGNGAQSPRYQRRSGGYGV